MSWNFNKPVFRPSDISTGLVGYWKFNNDATDSSGKGYDLTAVDSPAYDVADYWKSGEYSVHPDGSADYFTRARNTDLDLLNKLTITAWVKLDDLGNYHSIITKDSGVGGYIIYIDATTGIVNFQTAGTAHASTTGLSAGKWHHLACVYDQATKRIYIDGNLNYSVAWTTDCTDTAGNLTIGASDAHNTLQFDGNLKDLAVWSEALTPLQIKSLALGVDLSKYAYRPNNVSTQPTHWWKLNEVSGTRADSIGDHTLTDSTTTASGGGYVEGVSALYSSDYFSRANSTDYDFSTGDFTLRARIKFTTVGSDTYYNIMGKYGGGSSGWLWKVDPYSGTLLSRVTVDSTNIDFTIPQPTAGVWYDYVLQKSGTSIKLFIDGIQAGSTGTITTVNGDAVSFNLGGAGNNAGSFTGNMEDVAIWKGYALTDSEIKSLACALPIQRQGIVSYWKGANVNDSIGSNTLTNNGSVTFGSGLVGNCSIFSGANSLSSGDISLAITSDMNVLTWVKTAGVAADGGFLGRGFQANGYAFYKGGSGQVNWYGKDGAGSTVAPDTNVWTHMVGVTTGATNALYKNACLVGETAGANPTNVSAGNFYLGWAGYAAYTDCSMNETIVAKRYFRPEEIKAVYLKGLNGKEVTTTEIAVGGNSQIIWID
jgi:hypothetical protein